MGCVPQTITSATFLGSLRYILFRSSYPHPASATTPTPFLLTPSYSLSFHPLPFPIALQGLDDCPCDPEGCQQHGDALQQGQTITVRPRDASNFRVFTYNHEGGLLLSLSLTLPHSLNILNLYPHP